MNSTIKCNGLPKNMSLISMQNITEDHFKGLILKIHYFSKANSNVVKEPFKSFETLFLFNYMI